VVVQSPAESFILRPFNIKTKIPLIMMKRNVLVLAGSMLLFAGAVRGQAKLVEKVTKTSSELVIPYEKYVLPNGLTVLVHEDHSDPVVHVDVTYHVAPPARKSASRALPTSSST
jgi:hypothetical protein